jgi:hypothetical protein
MGLPIEEIERGVSQTRAKLSETLDELRARMTPGQVIDQLTEYVRAGPTAEFFRNLASEIRENPLPLTLITIGVVWLIITTTRSSPVRSVVCDGVMTPSSGRIGVAESAARRGEFHQRRARPVPEDEAKRDQSQRTVEVMA